MKQQSNEDNINENNIENRNNMTAMQIIIRVRPLTQKQKSINDCQTIKIINNKNLILLDQHDDDSQKKNRNREIKCSFDYIYDAVFMIEIYDQSISNLLDGVLNGYNSTIIAYGATGCGKTYTMIGQQGRQGIFALSMIDLLGRVNHQKHFKNITIKLSYVEIYNEVIKDLLISQDKNLQIRQDSKEGGVQIIGATEILITSMIELNIVLKVGMANRSKDSTVSNEASSRSHAILMIKIQSTDKQFINKQQKQTLIGKFLLVDLAGSQKTAFLKGSKQIQSSKINRSLLTLGNCIQILAQSNGKTQFIPYRQSKLTRLLKESLGGNCRTAMIINISPFISSWQQTFNSLLYGNRAKNIKNITFKISQAQGNGVNYIMLINSLKRQNEDLKHQLKNHIKNKNNSLPQLKVDMSTNIQQRQAEKLKIKITNHFQQELKTIKIINQLTIKIDKLAFRLYGSQVESKSYKNKSLQKGDKDKDKKDNRLKAKISDLGRQKMNFEQKLEELVFKRAHILTEIKSSNLSHRLISQYRQKKIQLQLQEIKLRQARIENEHVQKELFMKQLKQEVHIRDKIIQEQKVLIQKNNIINRITYSNINFKHKQQQIHHLFQKLNVKKTSMPENYTKEKQLRNQSSFFQKDKSPNNNYKHSINIKPSQKIKKMPLVTNKRQRSQRVLIKNNLDDLSLQEAKQKRSNKNKSKIDELNYIYLQR